MPKLAGLFDEFPDLEKIEINNIAPILKSKYDLKLLENELGNKILYPHTVPTTVEDAAFEQSIVMEAIKIHNKKFYNANLRILYIPEKLFQRYVDTIKVLWLFIDTLKPKDITSIMVRVTGDGVKSAGSYIKPKIEGDGWIDLWVDGKKYDIKVGSVMSVPASKIRLDIRFESSVAKLFDQNSFSAEIKGGNLGLIVDARK